MPPKVLEQKKIDKVMEGEIINAGQWWDAQKGTPSNAKFTFCEEGTGDTYTLTLFKKDVYDGLQLTVGSKIKLIQPFFRKIEASNGKIYNNLSFRAVNEPFSIVKLI